MNKKILTAIGTIVITASVFADAPTAVYAKETTNAWFSVDVSGVTLPSTGWTKPTNGEVTKVNDVFALDTDYNDALKYEPTSSANKDFISFANRMYVYAGEVVPAANDSSDVQAALMLYADGSANKWKALVGGSFVELTDAPSTAEGWYDVLVDLNYNDGGKVRYSLKPDGASEYTVLKYNNATWLANNKGESITTKASVLAFSGETKIDDFGGRLVQVDEVEITVGGDVKMNVDDAWVTSQGGPDPAKDPAGAATWLNATPDNGNGLPRWESAAMGLNPSVPTSKPILKSVQSSNAAKVKFSMVKGNATDSQVAANGGVVVKYCVKTMDTPNGDATATSDPVSAGTDIELDVPASGVKYYKLQVTLENAQQQ